MHAPTVVSPQTLTNATTSAADQSRALIWWTAALIDLHTLLAGVAFTWLGAVFDFPDILREPADVVLPRFAADADAIRIVSP